MEIWKELYCRGRHQRSKFGQRTSFLICLETWTLIWLVQHMMGWQKSCFVQHVTCVGFPLIWTIVVISKNVTTFSKKKSISEYHFLLQRGSNVPMNWILKKNPRIMWRDQQSINQNFYLASGFSWLAKIWRYSNEILIYSESMGFVRNETRALMLMKHGSYSYPPFSYITSILEHPFLSSFPHQQFIKYKYG